ncbi:MAG TPA: GAF domain-containing protein, partial [Thermodesulfobacteriota bacterium]
MSAGGLFAVDSRGRVVEWSDEAAALIGVPASKALGRPCREAVDGRDPRSGEPVCGRACPPLAALGAGRLAGSVRLLAGRTPTGPQPVRCELFALPDRPGGAVGRLSPAEAPAGAAGATDGRRRADVVRDLSALATLAASLAADPLPRGLDRTLSVVREATGMESAEVFLADPTGRELLLAAYSGPFRRAFCEAPRLRPGEGLPGLVLSARAPEATAALDRDVRYVRTSVTAKGFRFGAWVPLAGTGGPVGVLGVASRHPRLDPEPDRLRLLTWAGGLLGSAIETWMLRFREELRAAADDAEAGDESGLDRLLRALLARAIEMGEADAGGVGLLDRRGLGVVRYVTDRGASIGACPGLLDGAAPFCPVVAAGVGATFGGPRTSWPLPCRLVRQGGVARSCLPIRTGAERAPLGVIQLVHARHPPSPPTRDLALVAGLAGGAAAILARVRDRVDRRLAAVAQVSRGVGPAAGPVAEPGRTEPYLVARCLGPFELRRGGVLVTP